MDSLFFFCSLRILYLTEFLSGIGGGGEQAFYENAKQVALLGHDTHILCHISNSREEERQADLARIKSSSGRLSLHRIKPELSLKHGSFPSFLQQVIYIMSMICNGYWLIRQYEIELIHANTLSPAIAGSILHILCRIPVIITVHHVHSIKSKRSTHRQLQGTQMTAKSRTYRLATLNLSGLFHTFYEKLIMTVLPFTAVHCVSSDSAKDLREFGYMGKIGVVPNGLDFNVLRQNPAANATEFDKLPYLVFVGRLVEYKNLDLILEGFVPVLGKFPDAKLIIIGDGPARKKWEEKSRLLTIDHRVAFAGHVSDEEKWLLLSNCRGLVFPSRVEGFGLVVLEAYALEKPVVVLDNPPLNSLVLDGIDGFVVSGSPRDWADKMIGLLQDTNLSTSMGKRGRSRVEVDYSIQKTAEKLEAFYSAILRCGSDERIRPLTN